MSHPVITTGHFLAAVLFAIASLFGGPAAAQFSIEIGISRDKAARAMVAQGYEQIEIYDKGFRTVRARACLNGTRYDVRVDDRYRVKNTKNIGSCRRQVSPDAIEANLANSGYTRIVIEEQNGKYIAIGCLGNDRLRVTYSRQGQVLDRRKIGRCEEIFQPNDVRKVLRDQGYDRIEFVDRQLPWYRAHACNRGRKFELLLTRFGEIRKSTRLGDCEKPLDPRQMVQYLEGKGYDRVAVIDDREPPYKAGACFKGDKVELELNRFGTITGRSVTGRCRNEMREEEIVALLRAEGFTRIDIDRARNGNFEISACHDGFQKLATLSKYGELIDERDGGRCAPPSLADLQERMKRRGFRDVRFFAEGCRDGRKVRLFFDENGERTGRERIGSC